MNSALGSYASASTILRSYIQILPLSKPIQINTGMSTETQSIQI